MIRNTVSSGCAPTILKSRTARLERPSSHLSEPNYGPDKVRVKRGQAPAADAGRPATRSERGPVRLRLTRHTSVRTEWLHIRDPDEHSSRSRANDSAMGRNLA